MLEEEGEHYSYNLCYVDDILYISHDPDDILNKLNWYVPLMPSSVGSPYMYLGTKFKCMHLHNDIRTWSVCPSMYVHEGVRISEEYLAKYLRKSHRLLRSR